MGQESSAVANPQMAAKNQAAKPAAAPLQKAKGPEFYTYVSREKINALVLVSESDVEKFILLLEQEVYKNDRRGMDCVCDRREQASKIVFIIECVFYFYRVPEHLRRFMWQAVKVCMDKRVLAKTTKA